MIQIIKMIVMLIDDSDEIKTPYTSNIDCIRNYYCDFDNPEDNNGSLTYYCAERPLCETNNDCPMGWKCLISEGFCITDAEHEGILCESDTDCVVEPNTKRNLATGECYNPNE